MRIASLTLSFLLTTAACLVDDSAPCGEGFVLTDDDACVCAAGSVYNPDSNGCEQCGENEVEQNGACVCDDGFFLQGGVCAAAPPGWGDLCSTAGSPCPGSLDCYAETGTSGYCTILGCNDGDCFGDYVCDTSGATAYCQAPPFGQGRSCSSPGDCAGTEALYCDSFMSGVCLVEGCTLSPDDCFPGWRCCDFSAVGASTLCIQAESCPF